MASYAVKYIVAHVRKQKTPAAAVGPRNEAAGAATRFRGDVVSIVMREPREDGYTVYGRLMPAADWLACADLPIGLAHGVKVTRRVAKG